MLDRLTVTLEHPEYAALLDVALAELRTPADQVRYMLRQELQRRCLLPADTSPAACPHSGRSAAPEIIM